MSHVSSEGEALRQGVAMPSPRGERRLPVALVLSRVASGLLPFVGLIGVFVLWQAVTMIFATPDYLLPSPITVFQRFLREWRPLLHNAGYTLIEVLAGFLASVVIGLPIAFSLVLSRSLERVVMPMLVASQAIPKVAIAPILVIWLGFGLIPKVAVSFLIAFFPVVVSTVTGLKSVETDMIDLVRSMGASTARIMLKVRLPAALPQIFAGLKVAICMALVGAIVGEFVGADHGLGYVLLTATGTLDGPLVWAALMILIVLGVVLYQIIAQIERYAIRWHVSVRTNDQNIITS